VVRRRYAFVDPLIGHLLAGQELRYTIVRRSQYHLFCVRPIRLDDDDDCGLEASLLFVYEDDDAPEKNLCLVSVLRLSESTDLLGTIVKCLQLLMVTPHFKPAAESASKELARLPTQDFSWVPYVGSSHKEQHAQQPGPVVSPRPAVLLPSYGGSSSSTMKLSDVADLEPVTEVSLQRLIPLSEYNKHRSNAVCLKNVPHLKIGVLLTPDAQVEKYRTETFG